MKRQPTTTDTCETCSNGTWYDVQWNRSIADGKPLTKHCPHYMNGKYGLLRNTPACQNYTRTK